MAEYPELVANYKDLPLLKRPAGYVYVIRDVEITGFYKIGYAKHPRHRFYTFADELPFKIKPVLIFQSDDAEEDEELLHQYFAEYRKTGEWFSLDNSQLKDLREMGRDRLVFAASNPRYVRPLQASNASLNNVYVSKEDYEHLPELEPTTEYVYLIQDVEFTKLFRIEWADDRENINWFGVKIPVRTKVVVIWSHHNAESRLKELYRRFAQYQSIGKWLDLDDLRLQELCDLIVSGEAWEQEPRTVQPPALPPTPSPTVLPQPQQTTTLGDLLTQDKPVPARRNRRPVQSTPLRQPRVAAKRAFGWKRALVFPALLILAISVALLPADITDRLSKVFMKLRTSVTTPLPTATLTLQPATIPTQRPAAALVSRPTITLTQRPSETPTQRPSTTPTPRPSETPTLRPSATLTPRPSATSTPRPSASPTLRPTATSTPRPSKTTATRETYTVRSANPYVRSCPSATCPFIGGLIAGDKIQSLGEESGTIPEGFSSDIWIKFNYDGKPGYIHSQLVLKDNPAGD